MSKTMSSSSGVDQEKFLIPLEEIHRATENFSPKNQLGDGGFGVVYRGQLSDRWENHIAAFERKDPARYQGGREFHNEVKMISILHHQNILRFIGYCDEDNEMIIVSVYAVNRSLDHYLNDPNKMCCITWEQRLKICLGIARGLEYLHSGLGDDNRVIHGDMKSANILLDENMEAQLCGFSLSRLGPRNQPRTQGYARVVNNPFYWDTHYMQGGILTKETDIHSLGMVLFEMFSGMPVFDRPHILQNFVQHYYDDEVHKYIDPCISDQIRRSSLNTFEKVVYKCLSVNEVNCPTLKKIIERIEKALEFQNNIKELAVNKNEETNLEDSEKLLPLNYKAIVQWSDRRVVYRNERELHSLLCAGIFSDGGNKWFSLSKLNGKNSLMISAMELFDENHIYFAGWESFLDSRFSKVARVSRQRSRTAKGRTILVTAPMLSLETTYALFIIAKYTSNIKDDADTQASPPQIPFDLFYDQQWIEIRSAEWRDKRWMEIELCHFTNHQEVAKFEFNLRWRRSLDYDLYVDGIEFRPIEMDTKEDETKVEELIDLESDTDWEKQLPTDYQEIIKKSTNLLHFTTKKQLYSLLVKGISIDNNSMWFQLDVSNGKKCVMLSSMMLKDNGILIEATKFEDDRSRFSMSWKVLFHGSLEFGGKMKAHMLSQSTPYAAWLVFKGDLIGTIATTSLSLGSQEKKTRRVYLSTSSAITQPLNDPEYDEDKIRYESHRVKLDRRLWQRVDGWYEVELFPFFNDMDARNELEVQLQINTQLYSEITIEGIEFRPQ